MKQLLRRASAGIGVVLLSVLALFFGCDGGCDGGVGLVALQVTPSSAVIAAGMTTQLEARAFYDDGASRTVTDSATWTSEDPAIATVDDQGLVTGVSDGTTTITATLDGQSDTAAITVSLSAVESLQIDPANVQIPVGVLQTFTAIATLADGTMVDATADVTWATTDTDILTFTGINVVRAEAPGTATVTATFEGITASATVEVTDAAITRIIVTPSPANTVTQVPVQFTALGIFSNGQSQDLTTSATWSSSDESVATIDASGLATPVQAGSTTITAEFMNVVSDAVDLDVRSTAIQGLQVVPTNALIPRGASQQFQVYALLEDDTQIDVTTLAMWTSNQPTVVDIDGNGLATAVGGVGSAVITASFAGYSADALVTVTDSVLSAIEIDPPTVPTMPIGATFQLNATGRFTDGTTRDVTDLVVWESSEPGFVSVSNAAGTQGLLTAVAAGDAEIVARIDDIEAPPVQVRVRADQSLSFITLNPPSAILSKGGQLQFRAIGHYTDGSTFDLTNNATWSAIEFDSMTAVTEFVVVRGLVTAIDSTAALPGGRGRVRAEVSGVVALAELTVRETEVVAIDVDCEAPTRLDCVPSDIGLDVQCTAIATYADNTTANVSGAVSWSSTAPTVAVQTSSIEGSAVFTVIGTGTASIRASFNGIMSVPSGDTDASIRGIIASLDSTLVIPPDAEINVGRQLQYQAQARYRSAVAGCGDGNDPYPVTVTELASWSSSNPTRVQVSNTAGTRGLATALSPGRAQIQSFFKGMVGAVQVDIIDACIENLVLAPSKLSLPIDVLRPMNALAEMSDGSVQQLTPGQSGLEWNTGAVDNQSWYLDTSELGTGSHTIDLIANAQLGTCSGEAESASATIEVDGAATLAGLSILPPSATIPTSGSQAFVAWASFVGYSDMFNVTPFATWTDPMALTASGLSNNRASRIFSAGISEGSTTINAVYRNRTALADLTVSGATVSSVQITAIRVGASSQNVLGVDFPVNLVLKFEAQVTMSNGTILTNPSGIQFESSDAAKLEFGPAPNHARTRTPSGETDPTVIARVSGVVSQPVAVSIVSGTLQDMAFSPDPASMPVNTRQSLSIGGVWSGINTVFDISDAVVCTSSNTALVQVSTTTSGTTLFASSTPTANTPVSITCRKNGLADAVDVFVRDTCVTALTMSPSSSAIPVGDSRDFRVFAQFSDSHTESRIATLGTWTTTNSSVLTVGEPVSDFARRFNAVAIGLAAVEFELDSVPNGIAVCEGGDLNDTSITSQANVLVTSAVIESVRIVPSPVGDASARRVPLGETVQLRALARLTNDEEVDITNAPGTVWTAQDPARASVTAEGMLTAHGVGLTVIDVRTANQKTSSLPVEVQNCGLPTVDIAATQSGKLPIGLERQFTASAFYASTSQGCNADQTERSFDDITDRVLWSSSAPAILAIATGGDDPGLATALSAGLARVRGLYRGTFTPYIDVLVVSVQLASLQILPASPIQTFVGAGGSVELDLVAEYTDGTDTFVLQPPNVNWLIIDPSIISISQNDVLTGLAVGGTTFRAQFGAIVSDPATVNVSPACITGVTITQPLARTFPHGVPFKIETSCQSSDGSLLPCNPNFEVTQGSQVVDDFTGDFDQNGILRIASNPLGTTATVRAYATGCAGIVDDDTTVIAGTATLRTISLSPSELTIPRGTRGRFEGFGNYLGGTGLGTYDLTRVAQYTSSNPGVATADNDGLGNITAGNIDGTTFITANYDGVTSTGSFLTVSGKQLIGLDVQADSNCTGVVGNGFDAAYPAGGYSIDLFAVASYSDGSSGVVADPIWSLVAPVLPGTTISPAGRLRTGSTGGSQRVRVAKDSVFSFFELAVVPGSIATIDLIGPASVPNGVTAEFDATATLIGTTSACSTNEYAVTHNVLWASSNPALGKIVSSGTNAGQFTALASSGFVDVTAVRGTATGGPVVVDLTSAVPVSIRCEPLSVVNTVGTTGRLRAMVDNSDGSALPFIASQAQWNSWIQTGTESIVFGNDFQSGVFAATAVGNATVRPSLNGLQVTRGRFITIN